MNCSTLNISSAYLLYCIALSPALLVLYNSCTGNSTSDHLLTLPQLHHYKLRQEVHALNYLPGTQDNTGPGNQREGLRKLTEAKSNGFLKRNKHLMTGIVKNCCLFNQSNNAVTCSEHCHNSLLKFSWSLCCIPLSILKNDMLSFDNIFGFQKQENVRPGEKGR